MELAELSLRLEAAMVIAREAGAMALDFFDRRHELQIENKGPQDFVSKADREVETLFRERLNALFPNDAIIGEEHGGEIADPCWVIDPIDGTANFVRGLPYWCVTLAFVAQGRTRIGVTFDAIHDELFYAVLDGGAFRDGTPIVVSRRELATDACVGLAYSFKQDPDSFLKAAGHLLRSGVDQRRLGSSALLLAHTADGRFDGMIANYVNSWDVLAGLLLVEEAGGYASEYQDGRTLLEPASVIAGTHAILPVIETAVG